MKRAKLSRFILYLPRESVFTHLKPSLTITPATPFPSVSFKEPEILKSLFTTGFFFFTVSATSVAVVLSTTLWIIGSISCFRRCRVTPTATRTQQMKTTKPVFICFLFIFPPTLSLFLSYFYFTIEVIGLRVPLAFTRKALALPNFRNISRRTGMWFSSSVI